MVRVAMAICCVPREDLGALVANSARLVISPLRAEIRDGEVCFTTGRPPGG